MEGITMLLAQAGACFGRYLLYLACCIAVLVAARLLLLVPAEVWRKLLHGVAYTSSVFMMAVSETWAVPALCCALFAVVVYPVLALAERWPGYAALFNQRRAGEVKKSLLLLFFSHAALIALCWGVLGQPWIAVTAILMWGTGDAMAALVGKRYGRRRVRLPHADPHKTWAGTGAMVATAALTGFAAMRVCAPYSWGVCLALALLCAPVAAYVELISRDGNDTVTVAAAVAAALALLSGCLGLLA